jgi:hypothetical protein
MSLARTVEHFRISQGWTPGPPEAVTPAVMQIDADAVGWMRCGKCRAAG